EIHDRERRLAGPNGRNRNPASCHRSRESIPSIPPIPSTYPELAANAAHTLIVVATSLLDRQLAALAAAFEREGGFTERLYRMRRGSRHAGPRPSPPRARR